MPQIENWTRECRTPKLAYRNTETNAHAVLHRAPDSYAHKWRAAILVDGYSVWSRGFATEEAKSLSDELRKRPQPDLPCPKCPNDDVVVASGVTAALLVAVVQDCSVPPTASQGDMADLNG